MGYKEGKQAKVLLSRVQQRVQGRRLIVVLSHTVYGFVFMIHYNMEEKKDDLFLSLCLMRSNTTNTVKQK